MVGCLPNCARPWIERRETEGREGGKERMEGGNNIKSIIRNNMDDFKRHYAQ